MHKIMEKTFELIDAMDESEMIKELEKYKRQVLENKEIQELLKVLNKECIIHKMCNKDQKLSNRSAISFIRHIGKSKDMNVDEFRKISENANACLCYTIDDDSIKEKLNNSKEALKRDFKVI